MDIGSVTSERVVSSAHRNQHAFKPEVDRARFDPPATSANGMKTLVGRSGLGGAISTAKSGFQRSLAVVQRCLDVRSQIVRGNRNRRSGSEIDVRSSRNKTSGMHSNDPVGLSAGRGLNKLHKPRSEDRLFLADLDMPLAPPHPG
jgi:hypothetical protein